jgi:hypothetical protein
MYNNGQWLNIGNEADAVTGARVVMAATAASARIAMLIRLKVMILLKRDFDFGAVKYD